ncbi:MAG: MmcQ/YjbR family DNA-binding protein [Phycisphaerales bacterium]|nr:MmcQ/YjbR family DNA-binding protein [Phycisphaerales bacterium]
MSEEEFRAIALSMPGAAESSHMGHPDFRTALAAGSRSKRGKIFATLIDDEAGEVGVVMLTPQEQAALIAEAPGVFEPVSGKWGEGGATRVLLKRAGKRLVRRAVEMAWRGKGGGAGKSQMADRK